MIDRTHVLPISRQAKVLNISRGAVYYQPRPVSPKDLRVMRRIDELHLERPFAGARMLRDFLDREGIAVGRRHVASLMKRMGIEAIYRVNWVPAANMLLTRKFHYSTLTFNYDRGVSPGNGVYLTTRQEIANGAFSYTGLRKANIGISGGHVSFGSLTQTVGGYSSFTGGGGVTYKISGAFHFVARYDYRRYDIATTVFRRGSYRATIGFAFSPKDVPLSLW